MLIRVLKRINKYLPENFRLFLLPYYRKLFPHLNNIVFIPQLNCNYNCSYCIWGRFNPPELRDAYCSYTKWIEIFERLPPAAVIITGGEPLLYKDIIPLIEEFPKKHLISCFVTNLSINIYKLTSIKRKEFRIMASFHPSMVTKEKFAANLATLKKNGFNNVTINFVAYPSYLNDILNLKGYFEKTTGFFFRVDTFKDPQISYSPEELKHIRKFKEIGVIAKDRTERYDFSDFSSKLCKGGKKYFVMISNGNVYSCVEGYYYSECRPYKDKYNRADKFYLGNVFDGDFELSSQDRLCHSPCAELCDIELAGVRTLRENRESANC